MRNTPTATAFLCLTSASFLVWIAGGAFADGDGDKLSRQIKRLDLNGDGVLQRAEAPVGDYLFARGDADKDGQLNREEIAEVARLNEALKKVGGNKNKDLQRRFREADKDGDQHISREEFPATDDLFEKFDRDGDGKVNMDEALAFAVEEEIAKLFAKHDGDLSGTLTTAEVPDKDARLVLEAADVDGDGEVTGKEAYDFVYNARRDAARAAPAGESSPAPQLQGKDAAGELGVIGVLLEGFAESDRNHDGLLTRDEFPASNRLFASLDIDGDHAVDGGELRVRVNVAKDMGLRGKRIREAAKGLGMEQELAAIGFEVKAIFQAGRYDEARLLIDEIELLVERRRAGRSK